MEKTPKFIKKFSKEKSSEERQQAAQAIKAKRAEHHTRKGAQIERQAELQQATSERKQVLAEQLEEIRSLENEIAEYSTSRLGKILHYFKVQKLRADAIIGQKTHNELKQQQDTEVVEQQAISEKLDSKETPQELQEAKEILANFHKEQKEKWAGTEYTKEDIVRNFSEEHLASLSLEEYVLLLKRFPGEMVAHVTRQGIRDHTGHMFHAANEGAYADSFMRMVEDGRMRSPLGVYLVESEKEQAIAKFLHVEDFKTKEEALTHLATLTNESQGDPGSYVDGMAIHFATEEVADCYYGSERGNEIFITYPSAHVASQYYFNGQLNESGGGYWNDQWVWANEERGMNLNAGIVFIPEEARVDKETGSRYELDENRNPIKNSAHQEAFKKIVDSPDFHDFANQVMEILGNSIPSEQPLEELEPFRQRLEQKFGVTDRRLQKAILNFHHLQDLDIKKRKQEKEQNELVFIDSTIEEALKDEGILYKEAKNTIDSKEFWETHFAENPAKKPSKIVYYKASSPTAAFLQWRDVQGIHKKTEEKDIGFFERNVDRDATQATAGLDRFKMLAEKIIEDHFA